MFVDPEILDALDEEQKQILFIKMREEQVKRWKAFEEKCEKEQPAQGKKKKDESRRIKWLHGGDGEVWVWVMGEHKDDLSLEELIEKRDMEEARKIAEKEILTELEDNSTACLYPVEDETTLKQQLSRMGMGDMHENMNMNNVLSPSLTNDNNSKQKAAAAAAAAAVAVGTGAVPVMDENAQNFNTAATTYSYSTNNVKPTLSWSLTPSSSVATTATLLPCSSSNPNANVNQKPSPKSYTLTQQQYLSSTLPAKIDFTSTTRNDTNQNILSASLEGANVRMRSTAGTRPSLTDDDISKRQSEIFERMKEKHKKNNKEAEIEAERGKIAWEEQERKAREAEAQIRQIAQKAREQHRQQSLRTSTSILPALNDTKASSLREAIKNLPRPPKPKSRQAIVDWFRVVELKRGTGLDPKTRLPARWFHGIISRDQAEALLKGRPTGSFLVRVSDRIWGYTVSYVVDEGTSKHFLIERIPQGYQFLGTNQVVHEQLYDLITYHETAPITARGNEILKWPIGQYCSPPDYADLMMQVSSSADGRMTAPSSQQHHYQQQQQHFSVNPMKNTNASGNNVANKMYGWVGN
ncbi:unnamed protein product [Anisakis simplex]|uniref:SH2 domain-containing protein n=1 Tax=Anisakis simplex TaxID=6269 RepID=A0A0M3JVW9_ANISI|nr:unnamed protein product [Anisakis simplex]